MKNKPITYYFRFLVFLIPILLPFSFFLPYDIASDVVNWGFYVALPLFPLLSAIVFYKDKKLIWSAPAVCLFLSLSFSVFCFFFAGLPTDWDELGYFAILIYLVTAWSIVCAGAALLLQWLTAKVKRRVAG